MAEERVEIWFTIGETVFYELGRDLGHGFYRVAHPLLPGWIYGKVGREFFLTEVEAVSFAIDTWETQKRMAKDCVERLHLRRSMLELGELERPEDQEGEGEDGAEGG